MPNHDVISREGVNRYLPTLGLVWDLPTLFHKHCFQEKNPQKIVYYSNLYNHNKRENETIKLAQVLNPKK